MRRVVVLSEAAADLEEAGGFYDTKETGAGDYCIGSLTTDIESLSLLHGVHRMEHEFHRMLARRFPFGIYYRETSDETQVVAVLDLRRDPSWLHEELLKRSD